MLLFKKPKENPLWAKTSDQSVSFFGLKNNQAITHTHVRGPQVRACVWLFACGLAMSTLK